MKTIIIVCLLILFKIDYSNAQSWQWAKHIFSPGAERGTVGCIDAQGNSYTVGGFDGFSCIFDTDTLVGASSFLVKYGPGGNLIWAKKTGFTSIPNCSSGIFSLAYDSLSNSLLFAGAICGTFQLNSTIITSNSGNMDAIWGKADLNGNIIWYDTIKGQAEEQGRVIAYDNSDNVYVLGTNTYPIIIASDSLPTGVFMIKYNSNGILQWVKNISGRGKYPNTVSFLRSDMHISNNNLYISGTANDTMYIDTIQLINTNLHGTVIAKFNLNGNALWAKLAGNIYFGSTGFTSALDLEESIYTIQTIKDSAVFGGSKIYTNGARDIVIAKYDSSGTFDWVRQVDYSNASVAFYGAQAIIADRAGDLYVTGNFGGTAHFGNYTISTTNSSDMFLAKYTPNGDCIGVDNFGNAEGISVVVDNNNNPIVSGIFKNTVTIGNTSYTCNNVFDVFIAQHVAITNVKNQLKSNSNQLLIHANPNTGKCNIRVPDEMMHEKNLVLSIYNSQGKVIQQIPVNTNEEKIKINLEAEATGIYNAVLNNGNKSYSGKIVFE